MDTKVKSLLLIGLTLLIGFGAGFVANGWYVRYRLEQARSLVRDQGRFLERIEDELRLDPETRAAIKPVLRDHHARMRTLSETFRGQVGTEMDSLRAALAPHLTPEQIDALSRRLMMRRGGPPGARGPRPPIERLHQPPLPPPGGPGEP